MQDLFGLGGKLTGVGVQLRSEHKTEVNNLREQYHNEPALQVVSLSRIEEALRSAMSNMKAVVTILAWILAAMAVALLFNTALLRTLAEHKKMFILDAIGFQKRFIYAAALMENLFLVILGSLLGLLAAHFLGGWSTTLLIGYLPYAPSGNLVRVPGDLAAMILGASLIAALIATLPSLIRITWFSNVSAFRRD
jgi:ABC-type lipoprotein release transport system permease subunit